jgi:MOSC domain-containing protein YiiM
MKITKGRIIAVSISGDCVMPREGIFARVLKGGIVEPGDQIVAISN